LGGASDALAVMQENVMRRLAHIAKILFVAIFIGKPLNFFLMNAKDARMM
jgi:hypothetical protein